MTAILVDDEPLVRSHLRRLLEQQQVEIVAEGSTGIEALSLAEALKPEIAFLDVQMPDLSGMQAAAALNQIENPPLLVFVTGHSEHAHKAFEYAAFDYLLKPVEAERLAITLARASRRLFELDPRQSHNIKAQDLTPMSRLPVRSNYAIKLIRVEEVAYAIARDKKVYLRVGDQEQKTYYTLNQLESLLPSVDFLRIHASVIVRVSQIDELNFLGNHSYSVTVVDGSVLPVGRTYYLDLQKRLGLSKLDTP